MKIKYDKVNIGKHTYFRYRNWDNDLKQFTNVTYAKTKKELEEKTKNIFQKENAGIKGDNVLFQRFMQDWLTNTHLVDKKPSTCERYRSVYKNYIKDSFIGKIPLKSLTSESVQKFYNLIFEQKSREIVRTIDKIMRPCCRYAHDTGRTLRNVCATVKVPKETGILNPKEDKVKPMTLDEQMAFIDVIKGHPLEALLNTALDTGMRQGELFALTWRDIDFVNKEIHITKTYSYVTLADGKHHEMVTNPKTKGSVRVIPLPARVELILKAHAREQKAHYDHIGIEQNLDSIVFSNAIGGYLNRQNVLKRVKALYAAIGITDKNFHDLRHTYATRLFELEEQPKTVQVLLGHSNVNTTLETYTHVLERITRKAASKIDDLYKQPQSKIIQINQKIV